MPSNENAIVGIGGALASVFRVSKFFGFAAVSIQKSTTATPVYEYEIAVSQAYCIYSYIFIIIFMMANYSKTLYYKSYMYRERYRQLRSLFSILTFCAQLVSYSTIVFAAAFRVHTRMTRIIENLKTLEKLNWEMDRRCKYNNIKHAEALFWCSILTISCIAVTYMYINIGSFTAALENPAFTMSITIYFIVHMWIVLLQFQFVFIVCLINKTIRLFNARLKLLISKLKYHDENNLRNTVRKHRQIYESICNLVNKVNKEEGALNMFILIYKMLDLYDATYLIASIIENTSTFMIESLFLEIFWIIYRGATLILLIEPCHQTLKQICPTFISQLICISKKKEVIEELFKFSQQIGSHTPTFSLMGIWLFSRQMLSVILGAFFSNVAFIVDLDLKDNVPDQ